MSLSTGEIPSSVGSGLKPTIANLYNLLDQVYAGENHEVTHDEYLDLRAHLDKLIQSRIGQMKDPRLNRMEFKSVWNLADTASFEKTEDYAALRKFLINNSADPLTLYAAGFQRYSTATTSQSMSGRIGKLLQKSWVGLLLLGGVAAYKYLQEGDSQARVEPDPDIAPWTPHPQKHPTTPKKPDIAKPLKPVQPQELGQPKPLHPNQPQPTPAPASSENMNLAADNLIYAQAGKDKAKVTEKPADLKKKKKKKKKKEGKEKTGNGSLEALQAFDAKLNESQQKAADLLNEKTKIDPKDVEGKKKWLEKVQAFVKEQLQLISSLPTPKTGVGQKKYDNSKLGIQREIEKVLEAADLNPNNAKDRKWILLRADNLIGLRRRQQARELLIRLLPDAINEDEMNKILGRMIDLYVDDEFLHILKHLMKDERVGELSAYQRNAIWFWMYRYYVDQGEKCLVEQLQTLFNWINDTHKHPLYQNASDQSAKMRSKAERLVKQFVLEQLFKLMERHKEAMEAGEEVPELSKLLSILLEEVDQFTEEIAGEVAALLESNVRYIPATSETQKLINDLYDECWTIVEKAMDDRDEEILESTKQRR